jgi:hypothetical protein
MTPSPQGVSWDDQSQPLATTSAASPAATTTGTPVDASHPAIVWDDQSSPTPPPNGTIGDVFKGAGKGVLSTVSHAADLAQRITGKPKEKRILSNPIVQKDITPDNPMQSIGFGGEQALEYMAPMGLAGRAEKVIDAGSQVLGKGAPLARILGKSIVQGGTAGTVAAAQTGGDPTAVRNAALTSGATSAVLQGGTEAWNAAKPFVSEQTNPVERQALDWYKQQGMPLSTGQDTGSQQVNRIEQSLENVPGAAGKTQAFFDAQQPKIADIGNNLAASISPTQTNAYGAGKTVEDSLQKEIRSLKGDADNLYGQVRSAVTANPTQVQVGATLTPDPNDPTGHVSNPIMQAFNAPVNIQTLQAQMKPVYDDLTRLMPVARQQSSPAFQALSDLMKSQDPAMDAMDFDKYLSAVKSIARDGDSPYLTTRSQGLAKQIIGTGETELNNALAQADPTIPATLQRARSKVKAYYDVADLLNDIQGSKDEPAALYHNLVSGGDRTYDTLQRIHAIDPQVTQTLGRTYFESLLNKATAEGGFGRAPGLMQDWQRMGPQTKMLLFGGPTAVAELNNFFQGAKMLTNNANPSGTAKMLYALGPIGIGLDMAMGPGSPQDKIKRLGVEAPTAMFAMRGLSNLLLSPEGRQFLTSTVRSILPTIAGSGIPAATAGTEQWINQPNPNIHVQ